MEIVDPQGSLIAAYSFPYCIVKGTATNCAAANPANGFNPRQYNGTIYKSGNIPYGIYIPRPGYINFSVIPLFYIWSTCCIFKLNKYSVDLLNTLFGFASNTTVYIYNNKIDWFDGTTHNNIGPIINLNTWYTLILISNGSIIYFYLNSSLIGTYSSSTRLKISMKLVNIGYGGGGVRGLDGILKDFRFYNTVISQIQIKNYHNQFASQVVLNENFSNYAVGATRFGSWRAKTYAPSNISIKELTTLDPANIIKVGTKFMYNMFNEAFMPSTTAYGTWQWDILWTQATVGFYNGLHFIANSCNSLTMNAGYAILGYSGSSVLDTLYFTKGGVFEYGFSTTITSKATNGLLKLNTWYTFKVTRSTTGVFNVYINGVLFITYTDTTYTTSAFFGIAKPYFITQLANIQIQQGITV